MTIFQALTHIHVDNKQNMNECVCLLLSLSLNPSSQGKYRNSSRDQHRIIENTPAASTGTVTFAPPPLHDKALAAPDKGQSTNIHIIGQVTNLECVHLF